jgi:hypothetical protein
MRAHLMRRHGFATLLAAALLLWGAGFAQMEDGGAALPGQGEVVSALAADAGSSIASERLRSESNHGPRWRRTGLPPTA